MKTYTLLLTLVALLFLSGNLYSQRITFGAKGGISMSNLRSGNSDNPLSSGYSSRLGNNFGIYGQYHTSKTFSFSVGLEYSSQGGLKDKFQAYQIPLDYAQYFVPDELPPYLYANFKKETKLDYLLVPVLAKRNWKINQKFAVYAAAGPYIGFLLSAHQVITGSGPIFLDQNQEFPVPFSPELIEGKADIKADLHTVNVGVNGLIGFSYRFNQENAVFLECGGNYGFLSIYKSTAKGKNYTHSGVITVGYAFMFHERYKNRYHRTPYFKW